MAILGQQLDKVVMILSTGRTGTTALAEYLTQGFSGIRAVHEPRPSWRLRIAAHKYIAGKISRDQAIDQFASARRQLLTQSQQPIYAESNPFLVGFLDIMGEVFENVRIVHIVRDPRTMVRSALNFGVHRGLKRWVTELVPYWVIRPEQCEENPLKRWPEMSPLEVRAWMWNMKNQHLQQGPDLYGENYIRFRFEDLFREGGDGLRELADWIGIQEKPGELSSLLEKKVNASQPVGMPRWEEWNEEERLQLLQYCAPLMREYGYLS